jgi:triacylglycerol lipase
VLSYLSPARRRLVLAAVALVAAAALVVALTLVLSREAGPGAALMPAPQDEPGPVLLVPGYGGSSGGLQALARRLRTAGRDAEVLRLPGDGTGDLREQAETLDIAVRRTLSRTGARSVDVIGYSAGGVVARLWASESGRTLARRVVTLGSPHHGTQLATLAGVFIPDQCPLACQQLAPRSDLLEQLNTGDETADGPRWITVWSTADEVVAPPESARLEGAIDLAVQSVCPDSKVPHGALPSDPIVQAIVLAQLAAGPPPALSRADCARLSRQ